MSVGKKPRKPLPRSAPLPRGGRIKPRRRTAAEQAAKFEREYGGQARHDWVESLPCSACGRIPSVNAHTKGDGGKGRKASARFIAPLCKTHHDMSHDIGVRSFEARFNLDLAACAARTEAAWQAYQSGGLTPIGSIVPAALAGLLEDAGQVSACDPDHFVPTVTE